MDIHGKGSMVVAKELDRGKHGSESRNITSGVDGVENSLEIDKRDGTK